MTRSAKDEQPQRRNWVSALAPGAAVAAQAAFTRAGFSDPTLVLRWEEIAGPETARLARPIRLSEGPNGGVLTLKAEPGAALFLQHETRPLCERINGYLGRQAVSRLRFVQGPLAARPAPPARRPPPGSISPSDPVQKYQGPEGLRAALLDLARARRSLTNMGG
ncbi:MAG: DciA family protein [Rhizomicrobium sp.]